MSSVYLWVIKNALCLEMASERPFRSDQKESLQSSPLILDLKRFVILIIDGSVVLINQTMEKLPTFA